MAETTVGMVGGGIARILLGGWQRADAPLSRIVVSDADPSVLDRLHAQYRRS